MLKVFQIDKQKRNLNLWCYDSRTVPLFGDSKFNPFLKYSKTTIFLVSFNLCFENYANDISFYKKGGVDGELFDKNM